MIVMLFVAALVVGVLVGLGARGLTRSAVERPFARHEGRTLSGEAAALGYRSEQDLLADRDRAGQALREVLEAGPGTQRVWENPETGNRGLVWASAETVRPDGAVCRDLERRTLINNSYRNAAAVACRPPHGGWDGAVQWRQD